jgi:galactokinase
MSGAAHSFEAAFGHAPEGVWSAPGRVNLIGEHTDYNRGFVLPFAIDLRTSCALSIRHDGVIRVTSSHTGEVVSTTLDALAPAALDGWSAYPLGVAWALLSEGGNPVGFDAAFHSDVPIGAGLSSSAAIECAIAVALNEAWGIGATRMDLALACQRAENQAVGAPTGVMDQTASLLGEPDHAVLLDCDTLAPTLVALGLEAAGLAIMVIDSRVEHAHATGGYSARRADCEAAAAALGIASLRQLTLGDLAAAGAVLDERVMRRVRHIVTENDRVERTICMLASEGPSAIGQLMNASHASMRDDFEISVPEIDVAVEAAVAAGAVGARLTGGGFGGASIALVARDAWDHIARSIVTALLSRDMAAPHIFEVRPSHGAHRDS